MNNQLQELARDLVTAALALRVFGPPAVALLRRVVAAGVRVGVTELHRGAPGDGEGR
ncbi:MULTISPECIES: hypothetical protein [unclassified Streptomyces]|uniref:hypothetical protein n=1 Tax=unclassified Streptomyces TaxID=2593676 RepID=UPI002DDC3323|nr:MULTISPECIES: hypothetical protein [unclassified Streptomyces]WSA91302.1 hypothetical protein OIE63_06875 [Streptomyces sp. NBC_01795]WSB75626.1 hypothetical protein OHB04_07400 [Streptomyces sp. NBC_01775]WSS16089.1 hypothetical protein OG533_32490 [Streptomyces sp. NBC_01186]WSS44908.1 hypothetical protein OG220_33165 [Streptomyces sp. NBC_01187]